MFIKTIPATLLLAAGILGAAPSAQAGNVQVGIGIHGPNGSLHVSGGTSQHYNPGWQYNSWHTCQPGEAIRAAAYRHYVRSPRIERIGDRFIIVEGWQRSGRVTLGFNRFSPRCDLAWMKPAPAPHPYGYRPMPHPHGSYRPYGR